MRFYLLDGTLLTATLGLRHRNVTTRCPNPPNDWRPTSAIARVFDNKVDGDRHGADTYALITL